MKSILAFLTVVLFALMAVNSPAARIAQGQIQGEVVDPHGAAIRDATVTLVSQESGEVKTALTDAGGLFSFAGLQPGGYKLNISKSGFQTLVRPDIRISEGQKLTLELKLEIAPTVEQLEVTERLPTDPVYTELREIGFSGDVATVENVELKRDAGRFQLLQGKLYFFSPVLDRVMGAVFVGQGRFLMRPPIPVERDFLRHFLRGAEDPTLVNEPFDRLILYFTDSTYEELKAQTGTVHGSVPSSVVDQFKAHQREVRRQLRQTIELRILADLYDPLRQSHAGNSDTAYRGVFTAFIKGRNHKKLIFGTDPLGFIPSLPSPEEVGLLSYDRKTRGIWSLFHYQDEYKRQVASSSEDHREYDITHYRIDAVIDRGEHLTSSAEVTFTPREAGLRVIPFALFPRLRVSRVIDEGGEQLPFIQADREEGGAFAVVYPKPLPQVARTVRIEYRGSGAIRDSGGGNYILVPRSTWYPNNWQTTFGDRATFDMTFHIQRHAQIIATAKRVRQWDEGKYTVSQWISDFPLAVAGFNYGNFRVLAKKDRGFDIKVFTNREEPDEIKRIQHRADEIERQGQTGGRGAPAMVVNAPLGNLSTAGLAKAAVAEAINSIRIYNQYFGDDPYRQLVMSQQPAAFFGQSWPMLVYMPYTAFLDSTQRHALGLSSRFTEFTDVVGPHEIAHQWWGHLVSWKTYRDQWLSEGFAEFSASLYLQLAYHKDARKRQKRVLAFWKRERERIMRKVPLGAQRASVRPNDVGPIWLGSRLNNGRTGGAYARLVYPKGAFVLHMLRMLMRDHRAKPGHQDDPFIAMMRDFVRTYMHKSASTEDFKRMVERHMPPEIDLDGNGRMDWFFNQWVYGTVVPHYRLEYDFAAAPGGKTLLRLKVTQSEVPPDFKMLIPIYLDFGKGKLARLGDARITGNSSQSAEIPIPKRPKAVKLCAYYDVLCSLEEVKAK